jgi:hypothetical protein
LTALAYVRARPCPRPLSFDIEAAVRARTNVRALRVVSRHGEGGLTLEPFVGSVSVAALLEVRRKVDDAVAVLHALASEARRDADESLIVRRREGEPEAPPTDVGRSDLRRALERSPVTVRLVGVLRRYRALVEVALHAPVDLGDKEASGYFAEVEIVASNRAHAELLLRESVASEGRVASIESIEALGLEEAAGAAVLQRSGRSYFGG